MGLSGCNLDSVKSNTAQGRLEPPTSKGTCSPLLLGMLQPPQCTPPPSGEGCSCLSLAGADPRRPASKEDHIRAARPPEWVWDSTVWPNPGSAHVPPLTPRQSTSPNGVEPPSCRPASVSGREVPHRRSHANATRKSQRYSMLFDLKL